MDQLAFLVDENVSPVENHLGIYINNIIFTLNERTKIFDC